MIAARTGNPEALEVLIEAGADVNAAEAERGTTPLMWAADQGHAAAAEVLIANGADVSARAAAAGRDARNNIGKESDPRRSVRNQVEGILEEVAGEGGLESLPEYLQRQVRERAEAQAAAGPPLAIPEEEDGEEGEESEEAEGDRVPQPGDADFQGFDRLTEEELDRDGGLMTPLVYAARANATEVARVLIEAGADVNQRAGYGWTPLLAATQNRNYQLGAFLIANGDNVNLATLGGWTPLYLATDNRNIEDGDYPTREPDMADLEYIRLLLDSGAAVNARVIDSTETRTVFTNQWLDEEGATAFLRAAQSGDIDLLRLLLEYGADPHINTTFNVTPLQVAAGIGWVEGVTQEHSTEKTVEAIRLLLDLGIDPNIQADTGRTALHGAAHKGATEVARILVAAGARMDVRDYGNTDNRGSPELASRTWLPVDYADGLVRVGVQSAIAHPETGLALRDLMTEAGLNPPPMNRTLDSICIVEVCQLFPEEIFGDAYIEVVEELVPAVEEE
jgi:ankyrin repeat protein